MSKNIELASRPHETIPYTPPIDEFWIQNYFSPLINITEERCNNI